MAQRRVLVLGGTGEGRGLASGLTAQGIAVTSSLAGRVSSPRLPEGEVRVGGFGGVEGLTEYLTAQGFSAVVDATHPFAARITANAAAACRATGTPLLVLHRPPWQPQPGDRWTSAPDIPGAAALLEATPATTRVLLTTGRQETRAFAPLPQHFWLRAVEPPDGPLPEHCRIILDRGPFTLDAERKLLHENRIDVLVTKNSGGPMTAAKLAAAREAGVGVIMVERPPLPPGVPTVSAVESALSWLRDLPGQR
ncbi:cobalt-precorrin-6A reductase [Kineosporia sp. J2-2]|uniref:Cobalt-precorrin-6A reductase n=1 Tax=Kineosporia corallincola TaxID=2835133 RepID=A0ABS5TPB3_9ACTN|nr:cobalt-precorrin-6A reductase [Kineosporia corallincola]MBT0772214.1 cobalt-precorrin-6A reductase [Kineosporia corallincola]